MRRLASVCLLFFTFAFVSHAQNTPLTVLEAGPTGPLAQLTDANEVRIIFSEPMVALGRVPSNPQIPWVTITPRVVGAFRWSGTTILIFTPDPAAPVPYATRFTVTVDANATSAGGRRLGTPYRFEFTTPTVQLTSARWYRKNQRANSPVVIALQFNQRVRPADVLAHVKARHEAHEWEAPAFNERELARMKSGDPAGLAAFQAKVAATRRTTQSMAPVALRLAPDWDRQRFPPSDSLVMVESVTVPAPGAWIAITADASMPSPAGREVRGEPSISVVELDDAFFARPMPCTDGCDPSGWNPVRFTRPVARRAFSAGLTIRDITDPARESPVTKPTTSTPPVDAESEADRAYNVEDGGFERQAPARTWRLRLDPTLRSEDGQTLGYTWIGIVDNQHEQAFVSFGDGHGVWEKSSGPILPFSSRNFRSVTQWLSRVSLDTLMPTLYSLQNDNFRTARTGPGTARNLTVRPDAIQAHGIDLTPVLSAGGTGLVHATVMPGTPIDRVAGRSDPDAVRTNDSPRSTIVQATNLGLTVKDSPQNTLVFVTSLDTGAPVAQARISIVNLKNVRVWQGMTNADGIAMAPALPIRDANAWELQFIVTAEKDGDVAYVGSDWNEGIHPWAFDLQYAIEEATPLLRGSVFTDRGVYKPGEEIHVKAIVRSDTPNGIRALPAGTALSVRTHDSRDRLVDERTIRLNTWSSAEWTWAVPAASALGNYRVEVEWPEAGAPAAVDGTRQTNYLRTIGGDFLVAAYRKPDFRVDATLTADAPIAGATLRASATAQYLFGSALASRPIRWTVTRQPEYGVPASIRNRYPEERFDFGAPARNLPSDVTVAGDTAAVDAAGLFSTTVTLDRTADLALRYTFEAEVEDVSRQRIANRASLVIHPAAFYVGLGVRDRFVNASDGASVAVVAADVNGRAVPGAQVTVALIREQWNSVRTAQGQGFYEWETTRTEVPAGSWTVTTGAEPVNLAIPVPEGGSYVIRATAQDAEGRSTRTESAFYSLGSGYTAWQRFDHNRITLTPERQTWKVGERARVMIESPWDTATALLTVEREGVRSHQRFTLTSTQQTVEIPITEDEIPNIYVSVLLIRGRTSNDFGQDGSDPGKPAFRLGYTQLKVEDATKRLSVAVSADRPEYRPASSARVSVKVADAASRGVASEVTLWAVDYGVLSLTGYQAPDVASAVYQAKALQVMTADSRQRIVSRRVLTPKGADAGGGGGLENVRQDFRPLAFWLGSVVTNADGTATTEVKLPDSLTTYRILAVAGDTASRFGSGSAEMKVSKPVTMLGAFPRFLSLGDTATFGAVVTNTLTAGGDARVTIRSLDPSIVEVTGSAAQNLTLAAGGSANVRFAAAARRVGLARLQMTVTLGANTDAFEATVPVTALTRLETSAAFGDTTDRSAIPFEVPAGVAPTTGSLSIDWASTAMVGLGTGARYLVNYPYGCAEQKASAAMAFLLAADLGSAFSLGEINPADYRARAVRLLQELATFQATDGGFSLWPGMGSDPYLTGYILHVMKVGQDLGVAPEAAVVERALDYMTQVLAQPAPAQVQWIPIWAASQAFGVKMLAEFGRDQDSNITRLVGVADRMPVFALSYLLDAMAATKDRGPRYVATLARVSNALRVEGDQTHVQELNEDALGWIWHSNIRSTAIVLSGMARRQDAPVMVPGLVRWLNLARKNGHWGSTQNNATTLEAMVRYYRAFESEVPDMTATAAIGERTVGTARFQGRSLVAQELRLAMPDLLRLAAAGSTTQLTMSKAGTGRLYYATRFQYALQQALPALDQGIRVERRYETFVENGDGRVDTSFSAGDLVRVVLRVTLPKERRYVAVTDPVPAGFEAVDGWFRTTASDLARESSGSGDDGASWWRRWQRGGFDHVQKFDDRVVIFATRLSDGTHEYSYLVRATTSGTFTAQGTWAEEMYAPEVNGRSAPATVVIR
ncbi:MAG: hypothetical protein IPL75_17375 [Acidobacteria bacterium]|nr:hypothetical protein [Acidobacteriota bacterium]